MYGSFCIFCWHGYDSNPKIIELLISSKYIKENDFISLGIFELELKSGKQIFPLDYSHIEDNNQIKDVKNIKYLKLIIKENYGNDDWTYINQIMLYDKSCQEVQKQLLKESHDNNKIIGKFKDLQISSDQKSKNSEDVFDYSNDESNINESKNNKNNTRSEENYLPINQSSYNEYLEKSINKNGKNKKNEININKKYEYDKKNKEINFNQINNDIFNENDVYNNDKIINNKNKIKYIKKNINEEPINKKSKIVNKKEKQLKQNILDSNNNRKKKYEEDEKYKKYYQNTSNNIENNYKRKNYIFGLSSNQVNNKIFPYTPNRVMGDKNNDFISNIDIQKRPYSPNITHFNIKKKDYNYKLNENKTKNFNNIKNIKEDEYDEVLKNNLKDLEKQINFLNLGLDITKENNNNINYINLNNNNSPLNNIEKKNYYTNIKNDNKNEINDLNKNLNNINLSKISYNNKSANNFYNKSIYSNSNNYSNINNYYKTNNYSNTNNLQISKVNHDNYFSNEKSPYKYNSPINYKKNNIENEGNSANNSFIEEQINNNINNINNIKNINNNIPSQYILKDLASNNTIDISHRISNLEKCVFDIKKEISSMSLVLSNLTSNNFFQNNFKEQIKQICEDYINEKMNTFENIKYNNNYKQNYNNDNHSLYSEFLNDENRQKTNFENNKKFEIEINKKIDQKLEYLGEEIKNHINNNLLKPSINQIENVMKQNIDEIKEKINEINKNNNINNNDNNNYIRDKNLKMLDSINNSDLMSKNTSKIRNEKYEEINRLGEKLYQKLKEKEEKLKLLKRETSKYLKENDINEND